MLKLSKKKGVALPEYVLILVFFSVALGATILQMNPDILKTYFQNSMGKGSTTKADGTLTLPVMGEPSP